MKKKTARMKRPVGRMKRSTKRTAPRPRNVYQALQRLLTLASQMQTRSAALESSLHMLREQERGKAIRDLLLALRNTSAGNLIAAPPDWVGENAPDVIVRGLLEALMETFAKTYPQYRRPHSLQTR